MHKFVRTSIVSFGLLSLTIATACTPVIDHHGFVTEDNAPVTAVVGTDSKETLLTKYGNPSSIGTFNDQVWYYIGDVQSQYAFYKPKTIERKVTVLNFDDRDTVTEIHQLTLANGRVIEYDGRKTPTRGREVTLLEQILGSVGRSPVTLPGGDVNLPSSAGGPRRQ